MTEISSGISDAVDALSDLAADFIEALDAQNKRPRTRQTYADSIKQFDEFLADKGMPRAVSSIRREHVESFITYLLREKRHPVTGALLKPATASVRFRALQSFFKWAVEEEDLIDESPMRSMKPPTIDEVPTPFLRDADLKRLLKACEGRAFEDRRDMAVIRLLIETGVRRTELTNLTTDDVDRENRVIHVQATSSKGRRGRTVGFGAKASVAVGRYLRARRAHPLARRGARELWLGRRGPMTDSGIAQIVRDRSIRAGLAPVHPHLLRHSWAHKQQQVMSESDVMALAGWRSSSMLRRYASAGASERAIEAQRRAGAFDNL